jgi:hypothetical protein
MQEQDDHHDSIASSTYAESRAYHPPSAIPLHCHLTQQD